MTTRATGTRSSRGARKKWCKDCLAEGVTSYRTPKHPGPRCPTHHRKVKAKRAAGRKAAHVEKNFTITAEEYDLLLAAQNGVCYICRKKPGQNKRLAVDHDHNMPCCGTEHEVEKGCRKCIRGLLHSKCNSFLGWTLDDPAAWERGAEYLRNPPARAILATTRGDTPCPSPSP